MTEKRAYIYAAFAVLLILISAAIPVAVIFMPSSALSAPEPPLHFANPSIPTEPLPNGIEEMRGLWIATVNNINFPSKKGLTSAKLAAELDGIVAFAKENGFNTILFQVRPAADALYKSKLFPASEFVSGKRGKAADGGFDCLEYLIKAAHDENIKVHAWVNPLRVTAGNTTYPQTDKSVLDTTYYAYQNQDAITAYADGKLYYDAGVPFVRELVASGVREICEGYDVDGIVFDDYFYPYPVDGKRFNDDKTYAEYGGGRSLADFRRQSINMLIEQCYNAVKAVDDGILFGVSPFGIWKNGGEGSDTRGLEAYETIYCDALAWAKGGYVDYIAPQVYWSFDTAAAPFDTVAKWWDEALKNTGVTLYINHGVYRYADGGMVSGELTAQMEFSRALDTYRGSMFYGYAALKNNSNGVCDEAKTVFGGRIIYFTQNY